MVPMGRKGNLRPILRGESRTPAGPKALAVGRNRQSPHASFARIASPLKSRPADHSLNDDASVMFCHPNRCSLLGVLSAIFWCCSCLGALPCVPSEAPRLPRGSEVGLPARLEKPIEHRASHGCRNPAPDPGDALRQAQRSTRTAEFRNAKFGTASLQASGLRGRLRRSLETSADGLSHPQRSKRSFRILFCIWLT